MFTTSTSPHASRPPDGAHTGCAALLVATGAEGLATMRDGLAAGLAGEGWDHGDAHRVLLAATEALANALEHGSNPGDPVVIGFQADRQSARVVVLDRGAGAAVPSDHGVPPVAAVRGRGLALMHHLADEMSVERPGGTLVRLDFRRHDSIRVVAA